MAKQMTRPMTPIQRAVLEYMADQPRGIASTYEVRYKNIGNLGALRRLSENGHIRQMPGLLRLDRDSSHWQITQAGRDALKNTEQEKNT